MSAMFPISADKVVGSLLGAAVGDALAFPFQGLSPVFTGALGREAVQAFHAHRSGRYPAGRTTAFTQLLLAAAEALADTSGEAPGETVGRFLFPPARDRLLVEPPAGLLAALDAWSRGGSCAPRAEAEPPIHLLPLALCGSPHEEALYRDLAAAARCTGQDAPEVLAAGAVFLAAVRHCLNAGEIVLGAILDTARDGARKFSETVAAGVDAIPDALFRAERDGACPLGNRAPAMRPVFAGLMSFVKSPYDCGRALLIALKSGGGCAAGFVCGALAGAFGGEAAIPAGLAQAVCDGAAARRCAWALAGRAECGAEREANGHSRA